MELIKPAFGLIFWMTISFGLVLFLLRKYAWKPILGSLKEREQNIADALNSAIKAKQDMEQLKAGNEQLLAEARNERDLILKEARQAKESIVNEARTKATEETDRLLKIARENIHNEKMAAITDLKNQVAHLSIEIAEKIMREKLASDEKQNALIRKMLEDVKLN
jgi:F-type H+-transporting ATPase subunit b